MRIFVDPQELAAGERVVRGDEHHYLSHVRRARAGDAVELVDGVGHRAQATIVTIDHDATTLAVGTPETILAQPPHVRAVIPLIKGDRMDICLEKLVETGVDAIVVYPAERSVVRLEADRKDARLAKYHAAVQAAARQSGRAQIPSVRIVESLEAALAALPASKRIVLDPTADETFATPEASDITIASGPEGGLTADELARLVRAEFAAMNLGPRVLRAETAPLVAVAVIRATTRT